ETSLLKNKKTIVFPEQKPDILFVDDEEGIGIAFSELLKDQGYNVRYIKSPQNALEIVEKEEFIPQLLISDMVMPQMNGIELSKRLRKKIPDLKCLFISGYSKDILSIKKISSDFTQFIQKPFTFEKLINKINALYMKSTTN
ncbi:response regulator, partial [Desulfothermus okinawensis]